MAIFDKRILAITDILRILKEIANTAFNLNIGEDVATI